MLQPFEEPGENIQSLGDRLEINSLLIDCAFALDSGAVSALNDIFSAHAEIDLSVVGGVRGRYADIKDSLPTGPFPAVNAHHLSHTNVHVSGDAATGCTICPGLTASRADNVSLIYHDEFLRTAAGWRIVKRTLLESRAQ